MYRLKTELPNGFSFTEKYADSEVMLIRQDSIIRLHVIWNLIIRPLNRLCTEFTQTTIHIQATRRAIQGLTLSAAAAFVIFVRQFGVRIAAVNVWAEICADVVE